MNEAVALARGRTMTLALTSALALCAWTDELGPRDLPSKAKRVAKEAQAARGKIAADLKVFAGKHREARPDAVAALEALVATWVPGVGEPSPSDRALLTEPELTFLSAASARLAANAKALLKVELGGAAGFESYRALGLDPANAEAAAVLGYEASGGVQRHPRYATRAGEGLQPSAFGWIDAKLGAAPGPDVAPSDSGWVPMSEADSRHATWESPHVLSFTFVEIRTTLPLQEVVPWAGGLDELVLWMRARFARIPGYREPDWPIDVRIYRTADECQDAQDSLPADGFAHWMPRDRHVVMLAEAFVPGRTMSMDYVAKHELAHGFLDLAFPHIDDPKTGLDNAVSGWLVEGFEVWVYGASPDRPNDPRFWPSVEPWKSQGATRLLDGDDVVSELVNAGYVASRQNPSGYIGGILADFCLADDLRWEGFARLTAKLKSYRETPDDFRALVGPPDDVSAALRDWLKQHSPKK